jgi:hypothetical protein
MSTSFFYRPAPPLSHFVATIWHYEGYTQPHALERLMPDGAMAMVVNLDEDVIRLYDRETHVCVSSLRGTVMVGAHDEFFVIDTAEQRCVLGVQFWPGGAYPFVDMPTDELRGEHFVIEGSLRERILEPGTPLARCQTMKAALLERARPPGTAPRYRRCGWSTRALRARTGRIETLRRAVPVHRRPDAKNLRPRAPLPGHPAPYCTARRHRPGRHRPCLRVLRSGAFQSRFPRFFRHQSLHVSGEENTAPEPRADLIFTIRGSCSQAE